MKNRFDGFNGRQSYKPASRHSLSADSINDTKRNKESRLPRLQTPPEWPSHRHHGSWNKVNTIPAVKTRQAFVGKRDKDEAIYNNYSKASLNIDHQPQFSNSMIGVPLVPYGSNHSGVSLPYPPMVYPVPMYMNPAPVLPPINNVPDQSMETVHSKTYTRVLSKNEAAKCIQKHFRGWRVRKSLSDPLYRISSIICADLLNDDVSYFMELVASSVYYSMKRPLTNLKKTDPLSQICQEITDEVINEVAIETVPATIKTIVSTHMTLSKAADWLEDFIDETIQPMIYTLALTSHAVYSYETALDEIIDEVITEMMTPVIMEEWRGIVQDHHEKQITEVSRFAEDRLVDSLYLDHFLGYLSGNSLSLYFKDYEEQIMDGVVCGILVEQFLSVDDSSQEVYTNKPLQNYHQEIYADMALDVILDDLCANLDEDIQDLRVT